MLKQKEVKLGDTDYVLQQFPSTRGLEVGIHLVKIAMGAADGFSDIPDEKSFLDTEINPARMAAGIFERIDEHGTPTFIKIVIKESLIKPDPANDFESWYENHFSANYNELYDLLAAIIEHNGYVDLIKKKMGDIMGIFYSGDGKDQESTPSSKARS